jgi:preprotein translocase subunit SecD
VSKSLSKSIILLFCTLLSLYCALPNFGLKLGSYTLGSKVNLGLDLKGGAHILYSVDLDTYMHDSLEILGESIKKSLRESKIGYKNLSVESNFLKVGLRTPDDLDALRKVVSSVDSSLVLIEEESSYKIYYDEVAREQMLTKVIEQSIEIIRLRVDATGTTEPTIQRQGNQYILLQVPGEQDPQKLQKLVGKTAKLTFHLVNEEANIRDALNGRIASGHTLISGEADNTFLVIKKKALLSGDSLTDAQVSFDRNSQPVVAFAFNNLGSRLFAAATKENVGKRIAIVLDNKLLSAPIINEPISGGSGTISGNFNIASANELAMLLRAGALPAPLKVIEERSVGASLGADSIESGIRAAVIGFSAIAVFMIWVYGVLGLFAIVALTLALLYILALLSLLGATLTLPGIAGIVLTMGMSVDANVLIYERIIEEMRNGSRESHAIRIGFKSAFATIADSNITTLVVALILYIFGVGAVRGFAVTLSIGIVSSMFTAVVATKLLVDMWFQLFKPKLSNLI